MESIRRGLVLLVTDDPPLRSTMTSVLQSMELEVISAVDYHDALEQRRARTPILVCVDLNLPRESGYDVCELIRREPSLLGVQILMMSDHGTPEEMADAEEAGANAFVRKPFGDELLERCVRALLEGRAPSLPTIRQLCPSDAPLSR